MAGTTQVGHAIGKKGPSLIKQIIYGITLGLLAGGLWKIHHWDLQRRTKEFYDLLDKGTITVVVDEEDLPYRKT